jgi:hypothetical protein
MSSINPRISPLTIEYALTVRFGDIFPHPLADWKGFKAKIDDCNKRIASPWSLLYKARRPWISVSEIATLHHI